MKTTHQAVRSAFFLPWFFSLKKVEGEPSLKAFEVTEENNGPDLESPLCFFLISDSRTDKARKLPSVFDQWLNVCATLVQLPSFPSRSPARGSNPPPPQQHLSGFAAPHGS